LHVEIEKRHALLRQAGVPGVDPIEPWPPAPELDQPAMPRHDAGWLRWKLPYWLEGARDCIELLLTDFFRRPSPERQSERMRDYLDSLVLRDVCEKRLTEIDRLTAEADRCLALMQPPELDISGTAAQG
jgi:hypothetical protein